jgi:bacterioferritin
LPVFTGCGSFPLSSLSVIRVTSIFFIGVCLAGVRTLAAPHKAGQVGGSYSFNKERRIVKGDPKVIAVLSEVLKAELTAINQYFLHAEMCENWGYEKLAKHTRKESIEEMVHAEKLMERILYLDGTPNMSDYFKINIGQNVKAQIENDLQVEYTAVKRLNKGVETCVELRDNGSRELLEGILTDEEEHIDWLEAQLHAIDEMGIENYLAQQLHEEKS